MMPYRDGSGSGIVMQICGVYATFSREEGILQQKYRDRMGGLSRYFSETPWSEVDLTLLIFRAHM